MSKINRYTRAMRQIRTPLAEAPTNSMQGIYVDTPFTVTTPPPEIIQGQGADYTQDADVNGQDTSGLFDANGDQLTAVPPETVDSPDNSYILGPMASMWYAWGNFTTIGYIREADRKMVNLASITGPLHTWDRSTGFNSYGQLTLEQALWFVDNPKYGGVDNDYANANYRAFYPGPPSSTTDQYGRYLCTITGVPKQEPGEYQPPDDFTPGSNVSGDDEKSPLRNIVPGSAKPKGKNWWDRAKDAFGDAKDALGDAYNRVKDALGDAADAALGWVENMNENVKDAMSDALPEALGRALRSFTDPFRYAGDMMFQGNPFNPDFGSVRPAGQSNYWSPDPKTAGTYTNPGAGKGVPGSKPNPTGKFTQAPRPKNMPRVSRSPLGQPQFKFPKGATNNLDNMITNVADDVVVNAAGKAAATKAGKFLGKAVPFVGAGIAVADATERVKNGDYGGAILSGLSAIPGPIGWLAMGTQIATDISGATGKKKSKNESYLMESKVGATAKQAFMKNGGDQIEMGDWAAAFLEELKTTKELTDYEKTFITSVFAGNTEGLMVADFQQVIGMIMVKIANKEYGGKNKKSTVEYYAPKTRKLLKEIKQPYVMPEEKKVKLTGYRPKLPNKDKMRQLADSMNVPEKVTFAKAETGTWKAGELERGRKSSQAKKNEVLELLGQGEDSWVYMTETSRKKSGKAMYENFTLMNEQGVGTYKISRKEPLRSDYVVFLEYEDGTKSTMLQSELNEKMSDQSEKWRKDWKEPIKYEDQPAYKKVKKILSKEIPLKDIQPEFPKKAPPKLDPETQMHPDMFKRHDYFTKLDPDSAKTMAAAPTGDPKIDAEVEKAKKKPK